MKNIFFSVFPLCIIIVLSLSLFSCNNYYTHIVKTLSSSICSSRFIQSIDIYWLTGIIVCRYLSILACPYLSIHLSIKVCLYLTENIHVYINQFFYIHQYISESVHIYLSVFMYVDLSLSICICLCLSIIINLSLSIRTNPGKNHRFSTQKRCSTPFFLFSSK